MSQRPPSTDRVSDPLKMAEHVCERLQLVPWPLSCWLSFDHDGSDTMTLHKAGSAEEALHRAKGRGVEVGTYRKGIAASRVRDDILEAYREQP